MFDALQLKRNKRLRLFALGNICLSSMLVLSATVLSGISTRAMAQELDNAALKELAIRGTWQADHAEYGLWTWGEDGSVCLRLGSADGDCFDTGTWEISGNILCYELTAWGESVGERVNCFTVNAMEGSRYETLFHGGAMVSRMFAFAVLD